MRLVVGQLIALVQRYPALVDGAFIIIAWVGVKLGVEYLHDAALHRVRDPAMAVAGADRRDLRDRVHLRADAGPGGSRSADGRARSTSSRTRRSTTSRKSTVSVACDGYRRAPGVSVVSRFSAPRM